MQEGSVAQSLEVSKVLAGWAAHCFNHFFTQLHWRRQRLRISAENESKVDVEQFSCRNKTSNLLLCITLPH